MSHPSNPKDRGRHPSNQHGVTHHGFWGLAPTKYEAPHATRSGYKESSNLSFYPNTNDHTPDRELVLHRNHLPVQRHLGVDRKVGENLHAGPLCGSVE
jgi:hypothetical protein